MAGDAVAGMPALADQGDGRGSRRNYGARRLGRRASAVRSPLDGLSRLDGGAEHAGRAMQ
ncbi:Hypothetical protein XFF4834R_chr03270 [Xanthomonas citri pv. fuscans]|nr:Hypothetical protein XFF4834R_chr03270 [Xanthomonas citri pv. fuscans]